MQLLQDGNYLLFIVVILALILLLSLFTVFKILKNKKNIQLLEKIEPQAEVSETKIFKVKQNRKIDRKKRNLIQHDKIKKDDFTVFKNVKVLIAEDNIINQKVITSILLDSGVDARVANNGEEVLAILKYDSDFSMIFMDLHMPIIDGFETTKLIRRNPDYNNIPIIALSGDIAADDIKKMLNAGMEAHLEKPLKMDALYDTLYTYTAGQEVQQNVIKADNIVDIDSSKGLEICAGDKEFYLEILDDFLSKYSDSADVIKEYLNATDSKSADRILLDILGVAANIGANKLYKSALDLKQSLVNPSDMEYINNLKQYERSLYKACEAIKEYKVLTSA